jgi:RsiW-degrading membrane proteinase PrsW (M82 family)
VQIIHEANAPHRARTWWGVGSLVIGAVLSLGGPAVFFGLILVGIWLIVSAAIRRSKTDDVVLSFIHTTASQNRRTAMADLYNDYKRQATAR